MPTLNVKKCLLFKALGNNYTDDDFADLCFSFGLELDEVVVESNESKPDKKCTVDEIIYKIDIPANRYDLLSIEGLSTALLIFQEKISIPKFRYTPISNSSIKVHVCPSTKKIPRPYVVAGILRNITFNQERYDSFIDLQDKLHHNICRKRSLVAIGTHDLDTMKPPVIYKAELPTDIKFRALNQEEEYTAKQLMDIYTTHAQLKQYLHIIRDKPVYPVVMDSNNVVLSLPPVINGYHSRITLNTKNVFIECTSTDLTKAIIVLDTLMCAFSKYCEDQYAMECCEVILDNVSYQYPEMKYRNENISIKKINKYLGINVTGNELVTLLNRMGLKSEFVECNKEIVVEIPPFRHDVLHACDIIEDVAIAYGYNNIRKTFPSISTISNQFSLNKLTEKLREHIAFNGFSEALTFSLCSIDDISVKLKKDIKNLSPVRISNPKTLEFEVARTLLLPGLLKTISCNRQMPLPLKLFEVSDVVLKDDTVGVGARNERHICIVYYNKQSGFEIVHGLLDKIMQMLQVPRDKDNGYYLKVTSDATYFPERCATILYKGRPIGTIGILHPDVITEFELTLPCSSFEFTIEPFL